ncbi:uncharacterized protein LOC127079815 [Lathyrus oleraceus]|uniref:uncharacterized protein LOC127079815 n=1 Tax=Pisum sativum TaxID=3888 RepID=UPI0021CE416A|nr:uncharacterized protein LOC127079815 [Pisum sativum]
MYRKKKIESPPNGVQPIHICVPGPFPYQNTKVVPWRYETNAYVDGKEIQIPDTDIVNITWTGGMSRSGYVFAPKYTPRVSPSPTIVPPKEKVFPPPSSQAGASAPATPIMTIVPAVIKVIPDKAVESKTSKGKRLMIEDEQVEGRKKGISVEEGQKFLKLIKKSDFKIVDQLGQTPSKISILSLLISFVAHRKALLKVLNIDHVIQDITIDQFDNVVANITANRYLGFNEAELPPEGNAHNKALHISVMYTNSLLSRVFVDIGSSLNVMSKATLSQLQFKGPEMRIIVLIVRDFDGSRRQVIGEVHLPICLGPHQFTITFQVMDINPAYSCLLGRPWIHAIGAVTSTLHQRLKFLIDNKLVIICGEEDLLVSKLSLFRYVETNERVVEIPLHRLEFEEVSSTISNHDQSSTTILSSVRSAKQTLEKGSLASWGQVVNMAEKYDKSGSGFRPLACKASPRMQKFNPVKFSSAGFQGNHTMAVIGESSGNKQKTPNLARRCPPGFKLTSWIASVIPIVYSEKTQCILFS